MLLIAVVISLRTCRLFTAFTFLAAKSKSKSLEVRQDKPWINRGVLFKRTIVSSHHIYQHLLVCILGKTHTCHGSHVDATMAKWLAINAKLLKYSADAFLLLVCGYCSPHWVSWLCRHWKKGIIVSIAATWFYWEEPSSLQLIYWPLSHMTIVSWRLKQRTFLFLFCLFFNHHVHFLVFSWPACA